MKAGWVHLVQGLPQLPKCRLYQAETEALWLPEESQPGALDIPSGNREAPSLLQQLKEKTEMVRKLTAMCVWAGGRP